MSENTGVSAALPEKDALLIQKVFKDPESSLLKTIRALFFGIELLQDEKDHIKSVFSDKDLLGLMYMRFLPDVSMSRNVGLGHLRHSWSGAEGMIFGATRDTIRQAFEYKQKAIQFTRDALALLVNPDGPKVPFTIKSIEDDPLQIELLSQNMFMDHIDKQLMLLQLVANQNSETPKEQGERRIRNSAK